MPGVGGLELARFARAAREDMAVVLCSGYSDTEAEAQSRAMGVIIVPKPVDQVLLARSLREALDARGPASKAA